MRKQTSRGGEWGWLPRGAPPSVGPSLLLMAPEAALTPSCLSLIDIVPLHIPLSCKPLWQVLCLAYIHVCRVADVVHFSMQKLNKYSLK